MRLHFTSLMHSVLMKSCDGEGMIEGQEEGTTDKGGGNEFASSELSSMVCKPLPSFLLADKTGLLCDDVSDA